MRHFDPLAFSQQIELLQGTSQYFRHFIASVRYTDGAKLVAEKCNAYWLLDAIASYQTNRFRLEHEFQVWKLNVTEGSAVLNCLVGDDEVVVSQKIGYTDFPIPEMTLWCAGSIIYHPNEH